MACGEGVNWGRTEPIQVPTNIGQSEPTTTHQSVHLDGGIDRWMDGWMDECGQENTFLSGYKGYVLSFFYLPTNNPLTICMNVYYHDTHMGSIHNSVGFSSAYPNITSLQWMLHSSWVLHVLVGVHP